MYSQSTKILSIAQEESQGISRTITEIEWLLLILVFLCQVFESPAADNRMAIFMALIFYTSFILSFRYTSLYETGSRWKIPIKTFAMILFITWVLWFAGRTSNPLVNAYLLVIITSALTLGKLATMLEMTLIAACIVLLGENSSAGEELSPSYIGRLTVQLAPMLLVAYITTMFSANIHFGLNQARLLSKTDELTGLYNMRGFRIMVDRLFGLTVRYKRPASILMIDSDNLKAVNDHHGHEAGNRLLKQVAKCIAAELRRTDVLARYGGDEFVVLLPETAASPAAEVAQRIVNAVAALPLEFEGRRIETSVSIGLACYPEDGHSIDAIKTRADQAMYLAKEQGRNRVIKLTA